MQPQSHSPARLLRITPWEQRALQFLAEGDTPTQVALRLGVSRLEGDVLLTALFAAMGVATRADAVAGARRRGLLVPLVTHDAVRDGSRPSRTASRTRSKGR